ncbi:haloacid dehalogenase superfamily, subfamily IA, variant 1 with third motif having Dx(3-4)D or Dx(3-4)E [Natronoarchaeum philippinense]|uniref:Haloacid dehalogenase superfamily, subfamily IA, variant 1 with third motif having Dx(3-4)D or Dx(3-4)E n=1 Tax=Natronoarchaeum philippinense TaxID=558529 RepID=A0A285NC81_NATPI|nr:HAD-IA family hydrolase [Natronoarchaeum philippinense]SNZ05556.1 haloacid dehalogenase superfamily, subfamily IA, variant 1 with third motif having Dx(3-4)D or Dx(3-4)E [Natronoarchaeum philippinense]
MYDAVIFDNDGVLTYLTEIDVLERAIETTFGEFGVADPPAEDIEALHHLTIDDLEAVADSYGFDPAAFWRRRDRNAALAQQAEIRAGRKPAFDDVDVLDGLDVPVGVVSNNQAELVAYVVDYYGLDAVDVAIGRQPTLSGLRTKKPDPSMIETVRSRLGVDEPLYVGDSQSDIVAADRAGIDSAFVRRSHRRDAELSTPATHEIEDLRGLPELVEAGE